MIAHSVARTAGLVLLAGLAAGNVGCKHARRVANACLTPDECAAPCPPEAKTAAPRATAKHTPSHTPAPAACPLPCPDAGCAAAPCVVEVRQAPPTVLKLPQQDVVVELPPRAAPVSPQAAPVPPMAAMSPVAPMAGGMMPTSVSHVPANRARLGFALDTIRIPFPILRPIAVPTQQEMTVAVPMAPMAVQPMAVQPMVQQAQFLQPVAPQAQFLQPVQPQAPQMQLVPVQPQAPQMQFLPVQPQAPVGPVAPQAPSAQSVEDYCRQVDALMRALEASKRAAGCPPTPGR